MWRLGEERIVLSHEVASFPASAGPAHAPGRVAGADADEFRRGASLGDAHRGRGLREAGPTAGTQAGHPLLPHPPCRPRRTGPGEQSLAVKA